jgi:hypothetical protein
LSWTLCSHPPPLRMLCCICLALTLLSAEERKSTFCSCTRENLPLFCARWTCFVCHCFQLLCYVSKLFMLCYKWAEWTHTALHHSSQGWIVWVDRKHSFMGSFSLASRNGQLSFYLSYLRVLWMRVQGPETSSPYLCTNHYLPAY